MASRSKPSRITRFPSFLAGTAVHLRSRCILEVQKGLLPLIEKSNKKCCPVQVGLGFPASFVWHRGFTRASLALRSKELICLFLLWTGSCPWYQICHSHHHELSLACPTWRMSSEVLEVQLSHTRLGFGTGRLQECLVCN